MRFNSLPFALRSFRKQKMYAAITTIGLSVALGASLLILSFVNHELSFEKCHENSDRIYRVGGTWTDGDLTRFLAATLYPLGPSLKEALPEVQEQVRLGRIDNVTIRIERDRTFKEPKFLLADPSVFSVFSIPLIHGDSLSVLSQPYSVVISEQASQDLFGGTAALGKTITVRDSVMLTVTGVMADLPLTTQLHTNFLASFATLEKMGEDIYTWDKTGSSEAYTFLMLPEATNPATMDEKIPEVLAVHLGEDAHKYDLHLQPLEDLYLGSKLSDELGPSGSMRDVYLFAGISLLLVLMACFNYMNLSASRVYHRYREIIVRSTAGASRSQLFVQFLSESVVLTSISMILGFAFYEYFIPHLETYVGKPLGVGLSDNVFVWLAAPVLVFIVGVLSGSYPAAIALQMRPKGSLLSYRPAGTGKSNFRRSLVIVQAVIAIAMVGFTSGINRQLSFIETYDHGFNPQNIWLLEFDEGATRDQKARLKRELQSIGLGEATLATNAPGESVFRGTLIFPPESDQSEPKFMETFTGDADYGSTFGLRLTQGRLLSDETIAAVPGAILVNETAVKQLGLEDPIGAQVSSSRGPLTIVGVVKDFLTLSLHNEIMPGIITNSATSGRLLAVRLPENGQEAVMNRIRDIWTAIFSGNIFNCHSLSGVMDDFYSEDHKLISLFSLSSAIAIIIACLGLLGLVSFAAERRTKEIGIRKSIGASVTSITRLLTTEFVILVAAAGLIAYPLTAYAINHWLENFVYRMEYGWSTYALVVMAVMLMSLSTVGFQVIKAARANPVDALRHE